jgi:CBS domain-containing protein
VSEWERARLDEVLPKRTGYNKVSHYMQTDVLTVQPDDSVEMVSDLMSWERIRYLPVEDAQGKLVGLVSLRAVLRHMAEQAKLPTRGEDTAAVADIMRNDLVTVSPDSQTLEAISLMRRHRIGCLPVVQNGSLVGVITEEDFMEIAADLLEGQVGPVEPPSTHPRRRTRT